LKGTDKIDPSLYENLVFSEELFEHVERAYGGADRGSLIAAGRGIRGASHAIDLS